MNSETQSSSTLAGNSDNGNRRSGIPWRVLAWSVVPLILLVPLIAMQFTDEVKWTAFDFIIAGALMTGMGVALEFALRKSGSLAYRVAFGVLLAAAFLLIWINGAVGIIGSENNAANLMYVGVLAVLFVGSLIARFEAKGMSYALFAGALVQVLVALIAAVAGLGSEEDGLFLLFALNGFFVVLFVFSGLLFQRASLDSNT